MKRDILVQPVMLLNSYSLMKKFMQSLLMITVDIHF